MSRRLAREVALRALFQIDVGRAQIDDAIAYNIEEFALTEKSAIFARQLVQGTLDHLEEIDELIRQAAIHWSVERMARTDRNIMRLAVFELIHRSDVPASVAVNEAVELAKKYGDADAGKFVNGVLGQVLRSTTST